MRIYPLLLLTLMIFASGCLGGSVRTDSNNGIAVNEFVVEPAVAEAGDNVRFYLDIENVGGTTAACVTSTLYGVDGWYDALTGAPLSLTPIMLMPQKGLTFNIFSGGMDFCYFDIGQIGGSSQVCASYRKDMGVSLSAFIGNSFTSLTTQFCQAASIKANSLDASSRLLRFTSALTPPMPERNKAGQSWMSEWILKPPVLPEGLKVDYPVTARTEYFYTSNAHVNIRAFNKNEYKTRQITGDPDIANAPLEVVNVYGAPIQVMATRGDNPMVINTEPVFGQQYELFSYTFELANVGNGYPLSTSGLDMPSGIGPSTERGFVFAVATINGPGAFFSNCLGQTGTGILIPSDYLGNLIKIRSDRRAPFGCQIGVDRSRWIDNPMGTISITFQIFYRYYTDKQVSIRVIGPERY